MKLHLISRIGTVLLLFVSLIIFQACDENEPTPTPDPGSDIDVESIASFPVGESRTVSGNLSGGIQLDLDWADQSNVACFPGTRFVEFQGNQKFYRVEIPQGAELIATVTPTGEKKRINIYGYINFDGNNTPPVNSVTSCEAGYELYVGSPDLTKPGEPQDISFAQAVNRSWTALLVVSGAKDVLEGDYDLTVALEPM